jgi:hypothetical protein
MRIAANLAARKTGKPAAKKADAKKSVSKKKG